MADLTDELRRELGVPYLDKAERVVAMRGGGYWATMFRLTDGSPAAILRGGAPHVGLNGHLDMIRSADGGRTWSEPRIIAPPVDRLDVRGAACGVMADGTIVCGYVEADWFGSGSFDVSKVTFTSWYRYSVDDGDTWSEKIEMRADPIVNPALYGRILTLDDGTSLMTVYGKVKDCEHEYLQDGDAVVGIVRSIDNGRTWGDTTVVVKGFNETTLIKVPDGRLLAFMRQEGREVGVWKAESADEGRTWGEPVRLTGPHQHPADVTLLNSGKLLLTYGNRIGDLAVGAMISDDLGKTWNWDKRVIIARESLPLRGKTWADTGYPTTLQEPDGTINTMYYRLGNTRLPTDQQELCLAYERKEFENPPAPEDMRRFEEGICVRYSEEQLQELMA